MYSTKSKTSFSILRFVPRYIDRMYEHQGYRIPLPDSEELNVPEPVSNLPCRLVDIRLIKLPTIE